jgi:hypothetical protein
VLIFLEIGVRNDADMVQRGSMGWNSSKREQQQGVENMLRRSKKTSALVVTLLAVASLGLFGTAAAQKASVPRPQDKLTMGEDDVKQLLTLMDADKNGKVSKEKYMRFMEAEFERLDKEKKGELDVKELTKSTTTASRFAGK